MKVTKIAFLCIMFASATARAQAPTPEPPPPPDYRGPVSTSNGSSTVPKQISGGVLNGKAKSLPKPQYPAAGRAVGASGAVTVQVLIDETGAVISASAVSGHPLLRAAAVEAARGALFSPTLLAGQAVKVSGVITYNFVLPLSLAQISFAVAHAEATGSFGDYLTTGSIKNSLPRDWEAERRILDSLTFEPVQRSLPVAPPPANTSEKFTVMGNSGSTEPSILDLRSRETLKEFTDLLYARIGDNEVGRWNHEFGRALGRFVAYSDDIGMFGEIVLNLEALAISVPVADVERADDVRKFVVLARQAVTERSLVEELKNTAVQLSRFTHK